jgi:hypothetical protein
MLKFINYFFPRTVTGVMASFQKTVDDLHKVASHNLKQYEKQEDTIADLLVKVDAATSKQKSAEAEATAAIKLANKLTNQFGLTK